MGCVVIKERILSAPVDFTDVQGLVRFGYGKMTEACYLLLKIRQPDAARAWLAKAPVTTAEESDPPPVTALQIAFTSQGLNALGVPDGVVAGFSPEFVSGMAGEKNRCRRLGDIGENAPTNWNWGRQDQMPHLMVMLFAAPGGLDGRLQWIRDSSWQSAFEEIACLPTSNLGGREQFGFIDGISQPVIDWKRNRTVPINGDQLIYGNVVSLGEFLLGYSNEYGRYTDRPLLAPTDKSAQILLDAEDAPGKKDLGKNGTYVVFRQLEQDVRGFWKYAKKQSEQGHGKGDEVAEKLLGRRLEDGSPLATLHSTAIEGVGATGRPAAREKDVRLNQFTFDADPNGTECPFGAHLRRGNPRNADIPGNPKGLISHFLALLGFGQKNIRADLTASVRFHRLLRRGREYGPGLAPDQRTVDAPPGDPERGLQFVALNSNIERQFEFVQNAWMMQTKFDGMTEESDPLLGNREAVEGCPFTDSFSIPQDNRARKRLMNMPQFITVRGGAYFFLPGIRALKYLIDAGS
jgi:Dyp-type peroxidase family